MPSAVLFCGALISYAAPDVTAVWVMCGGLSIPLVAVVVGRLMHSSWLLKIRYTALAAIAPIAETAAIPTMIFLRNSNPGALVGILMICEGSRYTVYK